MGRYGDNGKGKTESLIQENSMAWKKTKTKHINVKERFAVTGNTETMEMQKKINNAHHHHIGSLFTQMFE